jgi:hypothetical protein
VIRFSCPRCHAILEAPRLRSGDKVACPKCSQRLQIPGTPRTQTVLAPIVPPPVSQPSDPLVSANPASTPTSAASSGELLAPQRLPYRGFLSRNRVLLAWIGTLLALAVVACTALALMFPMVFPRNPALSTTGNDGDLQMSVLLIEDLDLGGNRKVMVVNLLLENRSKTRKIDFHRTPGPLQLPKTWEIAITDEHGNKYPWSIPAMPWPFSLTGLMEMSALSRTLLAPAHPDLRPEDFIIVALPCEGPVDAAKVLVLDVPSPAEGSKHRFKFQVPIKRETITYRPLLSFVPLPATPETRTVLFKRSDFQDWLDKYRAKWK